MYVLYSTFLYCVSRVELRFVNSKINEYCIVLYCISTYTAYRAHGWMDRTCIIMQLVYTLQTVGNCLANSCGMSSVTRIWNSGWNVNDTGRATTTTTTSCRPWRVRSTKTSSRPTRPDRFHHYISIYRPTPRRRSTASGAIVSVCPSVRLSVCLFPLLNRVTFDFNLFPMVYGP